MKYLELSFEEIFKSVQKSTGHCWEKRKIKIYLKKSHLYGLEDNIVKMLISPQLIYNFNVIPIKIPAVFIKLTRYVVQVCRNKKYTRIINTLKKKVLNLLQYCFCFFFFWLQVMWDPSSLTRYRTHILCIERQSANN